MYTNGDNKLGTDLLNAWDKGNIRQQHAAQYGRALLAMESNNFDQARKTLQPLLSADPQNAWYLDLATDIDLGQKKTSDAINRLKKRPRAAHQSGTAAEPGQRLAAGRTARGSGDHF
ncbi:exported zinc metalloprotease YfgC [Klebsiella variicola]|uniref:Exported zinc metalloprotease YfgC n=1 Tax=Klebsiella variicola TaxID=244366 RepID=A0A7H4MQ73_KLEVA|nr:exported zinc metalloprotease YfgC [Klebsiella variicola]